MNQDPMYLRDVESHPKPGPWADSIRAMQAAGQEYPQIWHLFAFRPDATEHLARFTQAIMRGPAPLPPGMRELIAASTSAANHCPF
jgi:alkylhydroperoxidase family enzyme